MSNSDLPVRYLGQCQSWPPAQPARCWHWSLGLYMGHFAAWMAISDQAWGTMQIRAGSAVSSARSGEALGGAL